MKITYIHHSSFLVELEKNYLLFDYFKGELPAMDPEKHLYVFASHAHSDHFSQEIFHLAEPPHWAGERPTAPVTYILSRDIKESQIPGEALSLTVRLKPREIWQQDGIYVETFRSTDAGVAYWIRCEGKEIYHAGDLNNWWWEGEDKAWNHNMAANYQAELKRMEGRHADAAFVPLDPRQEKQYSLGMDQFMRCVYADTVFPMHFWGNYGIISKMKQDPVSEPYRDRIAEIHHEGEEFLL